MACEALASGGRSTTAARLPVDRFDRIANGPLWILKRTVCGGDEFRAAHAKAVPRTVRQSKFPYTRLPGWNRTYKYTQFDLKEGCVVSPGGFVPMGYVWACSWVQHLRPGLRKDEWSAEEELALFRAQKIHGNSWVLISNMLPGRCVVWIRSPCLRSTRPR